jgi:hypothetical protein
MKKLFTLFTLTFAVLYLFSSCEQMNKDIDEENPSVLLKGLTKSAKIWNTVNFTVEAADNKGIERVALFLDGDSITQVTETPYEFSFNSRNYEDGLYTLRVVAYDMAGNAQSEELEIEIFNTLVEVKVAEDYYGDINKGYLFISDKEGNTLSEVVELLNGETVRIPRPEDFNDTTFTLNQVFGYVYEKGVDEYFYIDSWTGFSPAKFEYGRQQSEESEVHFTVKVYGLEDTNYSLSSSSAYSYASTSDGVNVEYEVTMKVGRAFLFNFKDLYTEETKYLLLNEYEEGGVYEFDFAELSAHDQHNVAVSLPANTSSTYAYAYGYDEQFENGYYFLSSSLYDEEVAAAGGAFTVKYVKDAFPNYRFYCSLSMDDKTLSHSQVGSSLPTSYVPKEGLIQDVEILDEKSVKITPGSGLTLAYAYWDFSEWNSENNTYFSLSWYVDGDGKSVFKRPELPTSLADAHAVFKNELTYSGVSAGVYEGDIQTYADYLDFTFGADSDKNYYELVTRYDYERWYAPEEAARVARMSPNRLQEKYKREMERLHERR